jgi:hypothetical protein
VLAERRRLHRVEHERAHGVVGEWTDVHARSDRRHEPAVGVAPDRDHQPSLGSGSGGDAPEQVRRGFVDPLRVVDHDRQRTGPEACEQGEHDVGGAIRPVLCGDLVDLAGRAHIDVQHGRDERCERQQRGVELAHSRQQGGGHGRVRAALDAEQRAPRVAERPERGRRAVRLGTQRDHLDGRTSLHRLAHES